MSGIGNLRIVSKEPERNGQFWYSAYERSPEFVMPWWHDQYGSAPLVHEHWVSINFDDREVARCKYDLSNAYVHPVLGAFPYGQLDILAFEVAVSMRRKGIGRASIEALRALYPLPRLTALNDSCESRKFWDGIGWIRYESPHAFMRNIDRVTYSEV